MDRCHPGAVLLFDLVHDRLGRGFSHSSKERIFRAAAELNYRPNLGIHGTQGLSFIDDLVRSTVENWDQPEVFGPTSATVQKQNIYFEARYRVESNAKNPS